MFLHAFSYNFLNWYMRGCLSGQSEYLKKRLEYLSDSLL